MSDIAPEAPAQNFAYSTSDASAPDVIASNAGANASNTTDAVAAFIMEDGDPVLPDAIAAAPVMRPGSDNQTLSFATIPVPAEETQIAAAQTQPAQPAATPQTAQNTQQATPPVEMAALAPQTEAPVKKRSFLSAFFSPSQPAAPQPKMARPLIDPTANAPVVTASASPTQPRAQLATQSQTARQATTARNPAADANALPGVRPDSLFEISRRSGLDDDSDIDINEGDEPSYQVASAAGMARLAPNGLIKQTDNVDVACLKPSLVRVLKAVEKHYGRKAVVTSGYRSPDRNRRARGARNSLHMYCAAADVQVEGVSKWRLAEYVRTMPGRGGVGTYCHTESVHIDVGPERDWNWRCRRRK